MSESAFALPTSVSSPQDITSLIAEVRTFHQWYRGNAAKAHVNATNPSLPPQLSKPVVELIQSLSKRGGLNERAIDQLIGWLEDLKSSAPIITITLAAPVTGELRQTLIDWCRMHIAPTVLINFGFNPTILGGMVVRVGSRIYDWSFRRTLLERIGT